MSVKITYFVHGTTTNNEKNISSGWNDVDLSALGIQQSLDLKETIKDITFDAVFCSDLIRAQLTFDTTVPIISDPRLRECNYGEYNGQSSDIVEPLQEQSIYTKLSTPIAIVAHKAPQLALDVLLQHKSWEQAFAEDWRKTKSRKPGWEYMVGNISPKANIFFIKHTQHTK